MEVTRVATQDVALDVGPAPHRRLMSAWIAGSWRKSWASAVGSSDDARVIKLDSCARSDSARLI